MPDAYAQRICRTHHRRACATRICTDGRTDGLTEKYLRRGGILKVGNAHTCVRDSSDFEA